MTVSRLAVLLAAIPQLVCVTRRHILQCLLHSGKFTMFGHSGLTAPRHNVSLRAAVDGRGTLSPGSALIPDYGMDAWIYFPLHMGRSLGL